eukprot:s1865_g26.t1
MEEPEAEESVHWVENEVFASMFTTPEAGPSSAEEVHWLNDGVREWQWFEDEYYTHTDDGWIAFSEMKPWLDIEDILFSDPSAGKEVQDLYAAFDQKDVKEKLKEDPKPSPHQLKTKELGLEAAEKSAQKLLGNIKKQREKTSGYPSPTKSSPPVKSPSPATSTGMPAVPKMPAITNTSKKASKRESETPAEAHEVQVIEEDAAWDKIG